MGCHTTITTGLNLGRREQDCEKGQKKASQTKKCDGDRKSVKKSLKGGHSLTSNKITGGNVEVKSMLGTERGIKPATN